MNALKAGLAILLTITVAWIQYHVGSPYRYLLATGEVAALAWAVVYLFGKMKELERRTQEHDARLRAIADVAGKARVVHEAARIVDGILESMSDRHLEVVESEE